ncbi:unnamed protein product [Oppiella nova]|uniref:Glucose-methanol-choline oxidoreductase N-terminal domain-containing protein n=1 Tax=Oppiella nova TaxID=334625 RepID=A0A7R9MDG0_9ACAR|nr:unnamed protein product [Oppiella nova]CAG2174947.1 unnamed protein product [Oppiella nova]
MANIEVILSAGAFNSPQILMLSGIGPKDHLTQLGIPVLVDLPVGNNLQDHPTTSIHTTLNDERLANPGPLLNVQQLYEELVEKTGPLSVLTSSIFFYTTNSIQDKEWPNAYMYSIAEYVSNLNNTVAEMPAHRDVWMEYFRPYLNRHLLLTSPHLSRIRSYGTLRLASSDPFVYPIIDPQFLAHPQDYKDLIETTKFILYFLTETKLSEYLSIIPEPIPGCSYCKNVKLYECDSYIECLTRETIKTGYHPVGTCRMGSARRSDVVVDERLRVKYVTGLRVCDASIMPQIINANTNAAAIAIGEKGADLIKQDNGY